MKNLLRLLNIDTEITKTGAIDIADIESRMLTQEQVECPVVHRFSPGLYIREVFMPAGTIALGHHQKHEHLNIFLKGSVTIVNDDLTTSELVAPMIFTGKPGRKFGYIHEDVVWLNIYPTNETDIETLEEILLDKSDTWKTNHELLVRAENAQQIADREDYKKVLAEFGFSEDEARRQSENQIDRIPMPSGGFKFAISKSGIQGDGVFATAPIEIGEIIGPARIDGLRTPLGRYVNHSTSPNAQMIFQGDTIYLAALSEIPGCRGGNLGDEITTDYRANIELVLKHEGTDLCQP